MNGWSRRPLARCTARANSSLPVPDSPSSSTVAFIALPIEVNREVIGVLACHRIRSRQRHLNDDLALLRILATLAGQLLQLEQLVAEERRQLA
ncbi:GAF domain-containing protein, partial [Hydrogenophaga sp.]|uniref:GAF domain-containing protein n=1 Tax=Hydrogenophaga sp. TaxID=1904254 RepID=UPI0039FD2F68